MIRRLACRDCCDKDRLYYVSKRDRHNWMQRHVFICLPTSPRRLCDECGRAIEGEIAHAVTLWRGGEPEPEHWEEDFGEVIPAQAVKVSDALVKDGGEE